MNEVEAIIQAPLFPRLKYDTMEEVLAAYYEYMDFLDEHGGQVSFVFEKRFHSNEYNPEYESTILYPSNGLKCARRLAYDNLGYEGKPIDTNARLNFLTGDLVEALDVAILSKVTYVYNAQMVMWLDLGGPTPSRGRPDLMVELTSGPVVLDIKSAAGRSFEGMSRSDFFEENYEAQLSAYADKLGCDAYFWLINKEKGPRTVVKLDPIPMDKVRENFRIALSATEDDLPERKYKPQAEMRQKKPTGREYLPVQCSYCPHVARCWNPEGFELVFENNKPRWIRE